MQNAHSGLMNKTYSILIIDDEPLARFSFKNLIDNRFPGFVVSGEAGTGPEGLELYNRLRPDIVMMDIQIPDLNGLETSRLILERHPESQIIILSAYDQFDYVQDAINHGVLGYLLKPVQEKKLARLLDLAVERLRTYRESRKNREQLVTYREIAEADMVSSFIYGSCGGLSSDFYADHLDPSVGSGYFALFRPDDIPSGFKQMSREIIEFLKHLPDCLPGRWIGGLLPVFIRTQSETRINTVLLDSIARRLQVVTGRKIRMGVGGIQSTPADFPLSYKQALNVLETGLPENSKSVYEYPREWESSFFSSLKSGNPGVALEIMGSFLEGLSQPDVSLSECQTGLMEFLIQFRRFLEDQGDAVNARLMGNLQRDILLRDERLELLGWIAQSLMDYLDTRQSGKGVDDLQIRKILKYIDLNDFKEISLESAARSIGLTPQYVSKIFKDKYEMNFLDYLISRRMELACRLLTESELTVREVASEVGYSDVSYFSRIFRKHQGKTPKEFRLTY